MNWTKMFDLTLHCLPVWFKLMVPIFSYTRNNLFRGPEGILKWTN
jgi:hypothetical protein